MSNVLALDVLGQSGDTVHEEVTVLSKEKFDWHFAMCPGGPAGMYGSYSNNPHLFDMQTYRKYVIDFSRFGHELEVNRVFRNESAKWEECCVQKNAVVNSRKVKTDIHFVVHTGGQRHVTVMPPRRH